MELERILTKEELKDRGFVRTQHHYGLSEIHKNSETNEVYLLKKVASGYKLVLSYVRGVKSD